MIQRLQVEVRMCVGSECRDHLVNFGSRIPASLGALWAAERVARFYRGLQVRIDRVQVRMALDAPGYASRSEWVAAEWWSGSNDPEVRMPPAAE